MTNIAASSNKLNILVLGDWIIDDYWVVDENKSDTSTFVGRFHYRSVHHAGGVTKRHCGAGRVVSILNKARWNPRTLEGPHIYGLGVWATTDSNTFLKMFSPPNLMGSNLYRVSGYSGNHGNKPPSNITLLNLGDILPLLKRPITQYNHKSSPSDDHFGTTRILRTYRQERDNVELISRLDWELSPDATSGAESSWFTYADVDSQVVMDKLKELISKLPESLDAIVVKDNGKGVVSAPFIKLFLRALRSHKNGLQDTPWFIQTKRWDPPYFQILENEVPVHLIVYQGVALDQVVDVPTWVSSNGIPTKNTLDALRSLDARFRLPPSNRRLCVLLTGPLSAVAIESRGATDASLIYQPVPNQNNVDVDCGVGSATAFFSALVFGMLHAPQATSSSSLIDGALRVAQSWIRSESGRLMRAAELDKPYELELMLVETKDSSSSTYSISLAAAPKGSTPLLDDVGTVFTNDFCQAEKRWRHSLVELGLVEYQNAKCIILSRASVELKGYVCCAESKRRSIAYLMEKIRSFNHRAGRSESGLILARPGSGKSRLIERLAAEMDLLLLSYNITNMATMEDLLLSFDQVVTAQAENRRKRIMVFIDEVNGVIDGQEVYEAFLTPLEDGYYYRAGTKRFIKPCIWMFVGTRSPADPSPGGKALKGSDFCSRLTFHQVDLSNAPAEEFDMLVMEYIYVGLTMATVKYPSLVSVHIDVMRFLASLKIERVGRECIPAVSNREVRRIIDSELCMDARGRANWRNINRMKNEYGHISDNMERIGYNDIGWVRVLRKEPSWDD